MLKPEKFTEGNRTGKFRAELEEPSIEKSLMAAGRWNGGNYRVFNPDEFWSTAEDVARLFLPKATNLPRGYPFVWRTLEVSGDPKP